MVFARADVVVVKLQDVSMVFDERLVSTKEESSADSVSQLPARLPDAVNHKVDITLREVQTCAPQVEDAIVEVKTAGDLAHKVPVVKSVDGRVVLGGSVLASKPIDTSPDSNHDGCCLYERPLKQVDFID